MRMCMVAHEDVVAHEDMMAYEEWRCNIVPSGLKCQRFNDRKTPEVDKLRKLDFIYWLIAQRP